MDACSPQRGSQAGGLDTVVDDLDVRAAIERSIAEINRSHSPFCRCKI
jgi:hypothetical protein